MRRPILPLLAALILPACGESVTGPANASIAGDWEISWDVMNGADEHSGVTCSTDLHFRLFQTGTEFSGELTEVGFLLCTEQDSVIVASGVTSEVISGGIVSGREIAFRLGSVGGTQSGTVSDTLMTGPARWEIPVGDGNVVVLTGTWTAHRVE